MSRRPDIDTDALVWRAREGAVSLITAALEGAVRDDPSLPAEALRVAEDAVPARQQADFRDRLLLCFSEIVGTVLAVTTQVVSGEGDGTVEDITTRALDYWRAIVPMILDGAPAADDLAGVGDLLTAELGAWLRDQTGGR